MIVEALKDHEDIVLRPVCGRFPISKICPWISFTEYVHNDSCWTKFQCLSFFLWSELVASGFHGGKMSWEMLVHPHSFTIWSPGWSVEEQTARAWSKQVKAAAQTAQEEGCRAETLMFHAKKVAQEKRQEEAAERARREAEEKARREAEEKARREAEEKARREAEEKARREAEEKARREAEEKARREAEEKARREAEEKARREAEEKARREAEEKARREAEEKARREAEEKARREAEEKARREAEEKARREAEEKADAYQGGEKLPEAEKFRCEAAEKVACEEKAKEGSAGDALEKPHEHKDHSNGAAMAVQTGSVCQAAKLDLPSQAVSTREVRLLVKSEACPKVPISARYLHLLPFGSNLFRSLENIIASRAVSTGLFLGTVADHWWR